jgi:hypothetical protein
MGAKGNYCPVDWNAPKRELYLFGTAEAVVFFTA